MHHVIGFKQSRGAINVTLRGGKKFVDVAVYWETKYRISTTTRGVLPSRLFNFQLLHSFHKERILAEVKQIH